LRSGHLRNDLALLARAREAAITAMQLLPALDSKSLIVAALIDEAGLTADAKTWLAARRLRSAVSAFDHLAAGHAPLADKIRASRPRTQVAGYARADASRLSPSYLRLARLSATPTSRRAPVRCSTTSRCTSSWCAIRPARLPRPSWPMSTRGNRTRQP
jgi:hypothetical protein